jgi:hypothetical protein
MATGRPSDRGRIALGKGTMLLCASSFVGRRDSSKNVTGQSDAGKCILLGPAAWRNAPRRKATRLRAVEASAKRKELARQAPGALFAVPDRFRESGSAP